MRPHVPQMAFDALTTTVVQNVIFSVGFEAQGNKTVTIHIGDNGVATISRHDVGLFTTYVADFKKISRNTTGTDIYVMYEGSLRTFGEHFYDPE